MEGTIESIAIAKESHWINVPGWCSQTVKEQSLSHTNALERYSSCTILSYMRADCLACKKKSK